MLEATGLVAKAADTSLVTSKPETVVPTYRIGQTLRGILTPSSVGAYQ